MSNSSWNPLTCPCLVSSMIREGCWLPKGTQQWSGPHGTSETRFSPLPSWPLTSWTSLENRDQLPHTTAVLPLNSRRLSEQSPTMMAASELKRPQWWWERELGAPRWVEGRLEFQDY